MKTLKNRQRGSSGVVVFIVVVAILVWWQWDTISGMFGGKAVAEVVDFQCAKDGRVSVDGRVRNISDSPLELRAVTAILDSSGKKSDYREAVVRPVPLPPGQVGDFRTDGPALPDGGSCRLDSFVDSTTGRAVAFTGHHR
jgi:hypothetical protein